MLTGVGGVLATLGMTLGSAAVIGAGRRWQQRTEMTPAQLAKHAIDTAQVAQKLVAIRRHVALPVGVGFGIRDAASAQAIAAHAEAVVIGSRVIQEIENGPADQAAARAGAWLAGIRRALDAREPAQAA